jgi:hypothetical protein
MKMGGQGGKSVAATTGETYHQYQKHIKVGLVRTVEGGGDKWMQWNI